MEPASLYLYHRSLPCVNLATLSHFSQSLLRIQKKLIANLCSGVKYIRVLIFTLVMQKADPVSLKKADFVSANIKYQTPNVWFKFFETVHFSSFAQCKGTLVYLHYQALPIQNCLNRSNYCNRPMPMTHRQHG